MDGEEPEPYYAHIPDLPGVWATGKTLERIAAMNSSPLSKAGSP